MCFVKVRSEPVDCTFIWEHDISALSTCQHKQGAVDELQGQVEIQPASSPAYAVQR